MYLIHQPSKVASMTIEAHLRAALDGPIERLHHLSDRGLERIAAMLALPGAIGPYADSLDHQLRVAGDVRRRMDESERVWVIAGFRDPLDLCISAFFQNIEAYCPWASFDADCVDLEAPRVIDFMLEQFQRYSAGAPPGTFNEALIDLRLDSPEIWFRDEFEALYGIDPYSVRVHPGAPYVQFHRGKFFFLLYRFEALATALPRIVSMLAGRSLDPRISDVNVGDTKSYGPLYREFRKRFRPPPEMLEHYYGSRYFSHFYGPAQPKWS